MPASTPILGWTGPRQPRLLIVGEAWGQSEQMTLQPFVGSSGQELFRMLGEANPSIEPALHAEICASMRYGAAWIRQREPWLTAAGIAYTSCFNLQPLGGKIESLCETKKENKNANPAFALARGLYLQEKFLPELARLRDEIAASKPNVIVAAGGTASWALLRASNISSIRGTAAIGCLDGVAPGLKVLPTYHPAGVLRQWSWRPIVVVDLIKASREAQFPELRRPQRSILVNPTLVELDGWLEWLQQSPPGLLSIDIETSHRQITCLGFAHNSHEAIVVPFVDLAKPGGSYWPTRQSEHRAWQFVQAMLELNCPKLFQNGVYDLQYLLRLGLRPTRCTEDTMLLHHSLYPELQKGLGFLGSVYTNEASWKLMRKQKASEQSTKADE